MRKTMLFLVLAFSASISLFGQIFSLDDDPSAPVGGPAVPGFFSAEDEFGCSGIQLGPSRSLAIFGWSDSDVLVPGPGFLAPINPLSYVDSLSSNHGWNFNPNISIFFSVDRLTNGICGSALQAQAAVWDQPGDTYATSSTYTHPQNFLGVLGGAPGCWSGWVMPTAGSSAVCGNFLVTDEAAWGLVSNSPGGPCPFCHDNVDGMDYFYQGNPLGNTLYWTLHPAQAAISGVSATDIMFSPPPFNAFNAYAKSYMMGLDCYGKDSIDGLVIFDQNLQYPNIAEPGKDFALFSLSPCSSTLNYLQSIGLPVDAATVFFTDFQGNFAIYLWSRDLAIGGNFTNVDALDFK